MKSGKLINFEESTKRTRRVQGAATGQHGTTLAHSWHPFSSLPKQHRIALKSTANVVFLLTQAHATLSSTARTGVTAKRSSVSGVVKSPYAKPHVCALLLGHRLALGLSPISSALWIEQVTSCVTASKREPLS